MLYFVKFNNQVIFKGNYYACLDYIETVQVGRDLITIGNRK